jgi:type IV secretory pathway VirD2 relaxase
MPPGTNPDKVLSAVQTLCREEFALKHRYVMALHTDSSHPHVHVVLKAKSEQGKRLNIQKATLKEWREKFAQHLRAQGVAASAMPRAVRGQKHSAVPLPIVWLNRRAKASEAHVRPETRAGRKTHEPRTR